MRNKSYTVLAGFALAVTLFLFAAPVTLTAQECDPTSPISLVSVASDGTQGSALWNANLSISDTGRYVAFVSYSSNLVPGDTNNAVDVFVRDTQLGITTRVSVASNGEEGNDYSGYPSISGDGRYVAFISSASNLVEGDTDDTADGYIHDLQTGETTRFFAPSGISTPWSSLSTPVISADNRIIVFENLADSLVEGDTNGQPDVFVFDFQTGITERVSVASDRSQADEDSFGPFSISGDGRFVAFESIATNLVPDDTNDYCEDWSYPSCEDVFMHDRVTGETVRVSVASNGMEGNNVSRNPSLSDDGRYVAFMSYASNLVAGDTNDQIDIFVHDRQTGITELVTRGTGGLPANMGSDEPSLSRNGRYVAFYSGASNLVSGETNSNQNIFVQDRQTKRIARISRSFDGQVENGQSYYPRISADGHYVAFWSDASNLVPGDTNNDGDIFIASVCAFFDSPTAFPHRNYTTGDITLTWNPITWAASYRIQVDTDTAFDNPFINEPTDKLEKPLSGLEPRVYYWRVQAIRASGSAGGWSAIESFTVGWE